MQIKKLQGKFMFAFFLLFFLQLSDSLAQNKKGIQWTDLETAELLSAKENKKIFISLYTNWCAWCKYMDQITYQDSNLVQYLNNNFISVKVDAESKDSLFFKKKIFLYDKAVGVNQFAIAVLNNNLKFPAYAILDEKSNMLSPFYGYLKPEELVQILHYYASNLYQKLSWESYKLSYPVNNFKK